MEKRRYGLALFLFLVTFFTGCRNPFDVKETISYKGLAADKISSIQYTMVKESFSESEGIFKEKIDVSYVAPNFQRIDTHYEKSGLRVSEVFNEKEYYILIEDQLRLKDSMGVEEPHIISISKEIDGLITNDVYKFYGYELKEDLETLVIGYEWGDESHGYRIKYWIADLSEMSLPLIEEYFIDNKLVARTTFKYSSINKEIDSDLFNLNTNHVNLVKDGYIEKYIWNLDEAKKYFTFKLINPGGILGYKCVGYYLIPPKEKCKLGIILFNGKEKIVLLQGDKSDVEMNDEINGLPPCKYEVIGNSFMLEFNTSDRHIKIQGSILNINDILKFSKELLK